jgi:hypothetical protein
MDFNRIGASASPVHTNMIKGRVLQADADVFCYECCDIEESVQQNWGSLRSYIHNMRKAAGAEHVMLHLTMGLKGGREQIATVKPYQENRSNRDPAVSARVWELRHLMANYRTDDCSPVVNVLQEADDSLCQWQLQQIKAHGRRSSIIMSVDKDLWMVEGLHVDPKTHKIYMVEGYGKTEYRDTGNVNPKLVGEGTSWFWHQMIMGDKADNIPGLPMLTGKLANKYVPTKKFNPDRKPLACGEAKAVAMFKGVRDDREACSRVLEAYQEYYTYGGVEMFMEQAFLLWMRRTSKLTDFQDWVIEATGFDLKFTKKQRERLQVYKKLAKELLDESYNKQRTDNHTHAKQR